MKSKRPSGLEDVIAPAIDLTIFQENDAEEGELSQGEEYSSRSQSPVESHKRYRSESPDQKPSVKHSKLDDDEDISKESLRRDEFNYEIDEIGLTEKERSLLNFRLIDYDLSRSEETRLAKLFKLWWRVKDEKKQMFFNQDLTSGPPHGVASSWKQFAQYANEGDTKIFDEIDKRRGYQTKSLAFQRDNVHSTCTKMRIACPVFLKEDYCCLCVKEGIAKPQDVTWRTRPKNEEKLESMIQQYVRTLEDHQSRLEREDQARSPAGTHTHRQYPERLPREDYVESKYHDRNQSRSNEHDRRGQSVGYSKDERYEYAQAQYDHYYRSYDEGRWEPSPYGSRSYQRSNAAAPGNRSKGEDQGGYEKISDSNFELIRSRLDLQQKQISEGLSHTAGKREELSAAIRASRTDWMKEALELQKAKNKQDELLIECERRIAALENFARYEKRKREALQSELTAMQSERASLRQELAAVQSELQGLSFRLSQGEQTVASLVRKDQRIVRLE